ncbi:hypothetical protein [Streptomyces graminilatus]|uniref:hypothetical protein n=1 Tax=Streptomyces graminilatus TaxID=1464070 RepID=UPI0006E18C9C|nr:hypothetical protein [Streptomyces graminilatus]
MRGNRRQLVKSAGVMVACAAVLIVVLATVGLAIPAAAGGGLGLTAALWVTALVLADLELAYPLTRKGRLRAAASRSTPLVDFTTAALAVRNAATTAWKVHTPESTLPHHEDPKVLSRALEQLDRALPALQAINVPAVTEAAVRLHAELHSLATGCTPPSQLAPGEWSACQQTIEIQLDTLLDLAHQVQQEHAARP